MPKEIKWSEYQKTLPLAYSIVELFIPKINSSDDMAKRINLAGEINKIIIERK